jgi:heme-degrading monooxygenase HmoA
VPALLIRLRVTDFDRWSCVFADQAETRRANGLQAERLLRSSADPTEVWILATWDDLFRARLFVKSDEHAEALARGGVSNLPDYWYLEEPDRPR